MTVLLLKYSGFFFNFALWKNFMKTFRRADARGISMSIAGKGEYLL